MNTFNSHEIWLSFLPLLLVNIFALSSIPLYIWVRKKAPKSKVEDELNKRHHSKLLNRWFKEYWYWVTSPIEKAALRLKLSPNFFTSLGFLICLGSGFAYFFGYLGLAGWCVILGGTCDMFDGRIARLTNHSSRAGAFYDSVMDRYGEVVTFMGLACFYRQHWFFYFILASLVGSVLVSYARARGESVGVTFQGGSMQRPERIVYLGVSSIFSPLFALMFGWIHPALNSNFLLYLAVIMIAVMTNWTAVYRTFWIYRELERKSQ
ncbi:MAG: CDP-alcohol phosphatidyltransferase family protein [Deltaproteobacteria bacterium]|nr:CDP-alcohol phosphatidyltransferase family protein [Deltaproteobacteria bacterium]